MINTSDACLLQRMLGFRSLCCRSYDPKGKYLAFDESLHPMGKPYWQLDCDELGSNFRMTDMQAAVGLIQLRKLDVMNQRRIEIAAEYTRRLSRVSPLAVLPDRKHVFHIFGVLVDNKEDFMWHMYTGHRIKVWSHYMPIHLTTAYRNLGHGPGECPVAESLFEKYVSIPIHPRMTDEVIQYVVDSIRELS